MLPLRSPKLNLRALALPAMMAFTVLGGVSTLSGCQTSGVGDPCLPQAIPSNGFFRKDVIIETNSVSCRTRVCLVYQFEGHPEHTFTSFDEPTSCISGPLDGGTDDAGPLGDPYCVTPQEVRDGIYCSCRCDAPAGIDVPLCDCPSGFSCQQIQEGGSDSLEGSYCVRSSAVDAGF